MALLIVRTILGILLRIGIVGAVAYVVRIVQAKLTPTNVGATITSGIAFLVLGIMGRTN